MLYRVILEPTAPFYIGHNTHARKSAAIVHSDTLHAALIDVAALIGSPLKDAAPNLRVSSLFPCWNGLYFYPKPYLPVPQSEQTTQMDGTNVDRKRMKSIRWVSEKILEAWLTGDPAPFQNHGVLKDIGGEALALAEEASPRGHLLPQKLVMRSLAPAVTVDRISSRTTPYERRGVRVNTREGVKAYFLADVPDSLKADFENLVDVLGIQGIGGERTIGYGAFHNTEFEPNPPIPWLAPAPGTPPPNLFYTVSLYLPSLEEVTKGALDEPAAYDCTLREGWIHDIAGTTTFKKSTSMCLEGGVFRKVADSHGEVRDVRPEDFSAHPVWRSGRAFEFFFNRPEN